MFTVPTSTVTDLLASVSSQISDTGFLAVLIFAAAVPLVFYIAKRLIGLVPKVK